jgi:hypothetical protein
VRTTLIVREKFLDWLVQLASIAWVTPHQLATSTWLGIVVSTSTKEAAPGAVQPAYLVSRVKLPALLDLALLVE